MTAKERLEMELEYIECNFKTFDSRVAERERLKDLSAVHTVNGHGVKSGKGGSGKASKEEKRESPNWVRHLDFTKDLKGTNMRGRKAVMTASGIGRGTKGSVKSANKLEWGNNTKVGVSGDDTNVNGGSINGLPPPPTTPLPPPPATPVPNVSGSRGMSHRGESPVPTSTNRGAAPNGSSGRHRGESPGPSGNRNRGESPGGSGNRNQGESPVPQMQQQQQQYQMQQQQQLQQTQQGSSDGSKQSRAVNGHSQSSGRENGDYSGSPVPNGASAGFNGYVRRGSLPSEKS
ncbi:hypothetical protein HK104_007769, partial [Borealophlyctis nickersoniae]